MERLTIENLLTQDALPRAASYVAGMCNVPNWLLELHDGKSILSLAVALVQAQSLCWHMKLRG